MQNFNERMHPLSEIEKNRKEKQKITFNTWKKQNDEKTTTYIILFTTFNFGAKQSELITFYYFK